MATASGVIDRSGIAVDLNEFGDVTFSEMPCPMRTVIGHRAEAITLGEHVFVHPASFGGVLAGSRPDLVTHELVHVAQWRRERFGFLPAYVGQYLRFRLLGVSHDAAYRSISYEMEAFAAGNAEA
jgi:hypothetical protein